jgi:pyrroloquinoline quinone biosynthesis protein B
MKYLIILVLLVNSLTACQSPNNAQQTSVIQPQNSAPPPQKKNYKVLNKQYLVVLGIAQDAGYPQAGCTKNCCKDVWQTPTNRKLAVSLGVVDKTAHKKWMIEATPDFREQLTLLDNYQKSASMLPEGIFLTHGHIGHYTGLMHLGREAIGAKNVKVYAMPRMKTFLSQNGPWSQLVKLKNISLQSIHADSSIQLSPQVQITPIQVPHRDEFTETVGYKIQGSKKTVLFIPDINKWQTWNVKLSEILKTVEVALLDGTFYKNGEIPNRDMSLIPHPFVEETIQLLKNLPPSEKVKVHFIHFNHTNPLIHADSKERKEVITQEGFNIAYEGQIIPLDK